MTTPIPAPQGFASWLDYAIATMDARGAFADKWFSADDIPVRDAAQAELDALRAAAKGIP